MPTKTSAIVLSVGILIAAASPAAANTHVGGVILPEPLNGPSIGPPPVPLIEREEFDHTISASYDDVEGTIALQTAVFAPARWGENHRAVQFSLGPRCLSERPVRENPEAEDRLYGVWETYNRDPRYERNEPGIRGAVTLEGYSGEVAASGSFDGVTFTVIFQAPQFAGHVWPCLSVSNAGEDETEGEREEHDIRLSAYPKPAPVTRHRPAPVTSHHAPAALAHTLTALANRRHTEGFSSRAMYLGNVRVTNNGWASGQPHFKDRRKKGDGGWIIFHKGGPHWRVITAGSAPCSGTCAVPSAVLEALHI